ncbi:Peroxide stress-activated histidine kinase mak1 [Trichoderma lentiforme]|uniref:histidine kinase n=1 Tax=Trichoderma lentiforme TaxID=1567552 RepID=A0A9P4XNI9_9HYPO|nr:Peroxide stress-activated histidine kinase mak1 [Trichoderma lentiforme]
MPRQSYSAEKRALFSPSLPIPASSSSTTTSTETPSPTSTASWTRRLELPTGPFTHWTVDDTDPTAARNGRVTANTSQDRYAHAKSAMAARRSSYPFSSSNPTAESTPSRPSVSRRITDVNGRGANDDDYQDQDHDQEQNQYQNQNRDDVDVNLHVDTSANANAHASANLDANVDDEHDSHTSSPTTLRSPVVNGSAEGETPTAEGPNQSQQKLVEYRGKLIRDLELRDISAQELPLGQPDKARVVPILEDAVLNSPYPTSSAFTTTSTESGNTIRGGMTPAPIASTPSYPFPRMAMPPGSLGPSGFSQPATQPSPASGYSRSPQAIAFEHRGVLDRVLSETSTPASVLNFQPGATPQPDNFDFPTPNLYDLSLMLSAEPGLDAWWSTVVQVMREVYKAERVTLAIPADTTDIENVPWGQKATYNEHEQDDLSMEYLARGTSAVQSTENDAADDVAASPTAGTPVDGPKRPAFASRHSFTSFEENKERSQDGLVMAAPRRPAYLTRSQTHSASIHTAAAPENDHAKLNKSTLEQHDCIEEEQQQQQQQRDIPSWEASFAAKYNGQGRVLPVLQALDYEADPLIDNTGVMRVLERGRPVALTRNYPYLAPVAPSVPPMGQIGVLRSGPRTPGQELPKRPKNKRSDSATKLSSFFSGATGATRASIRAKVHFGDTILDDDSPRPPTPKYEEYEQTPPSPWSQSPAPSPAVRPDPKENPFFTDATVDEESFNPDPTPTDYTTLRPPEAIGVDHSWTVLHIPLSNVLASKLQPHPFKLDATTMHQKSHSRSSQSPESTHRQHLTEPETQKKDKPAPIAILSILSPVIPYPANLRHSLEHLAPHLATSFSLCRHYTNLETELAGLKRRRPSTAGFGAVSAYGRPIESAAYLAADETAVLQQSLAGSITSPSDYSGISKSTADSPAGTPGWDSGALVYLAERRQPAASPAGVSQSSGGYFGSKLARQNSQRSRAGSKDDPSGDVRPSRLSGNKVPQTPQAAMMDTDEFADRHTGSSDEPNPRDVHSRNSLDGSVDLDPLAGDRYPESLKLEQGPFKRSHTLLHSYGADFASTFQSLPPGASLPGRPPLASNVGVLHRSSSFIASAADMPPPSDKLKGLILDSLPAQVFVALPQTGEIVWVNSRYLSYRGQTVADLSADPWGSIHPDERDEYLSAWSHSLRTGEQFSSTVRIKRFDGAYRWFYARAVASKDKRGAVVQFLGSYLDIHEQRIAEIKAARQQEVEASEAKHRLLANLIPQIIFTATEEDGVTFANEQWLSYTGQSFDDALRLGFMDFVHPEDLARCRIPSSQPTSPPSSSNRKDNGSSISSDTTNTPTGATKERLAQSQGHGRKPSKQLDSGKETGYQLANPEIAELAKKGVIKVGTDSNGRLSYTTEVRLRSKTGEYRWHLIRCVEIDTIDFGSGASSYFGSATDINDHKLLEAKLKEAMESKGRFLSNMSHEIRTPLIGISGMVSFLQDTTLNEEQRDYTNTIQTSANSLIMIINDILDLSKVDAGMMKLRYEWFHTRSLIEDVNELVSTMAISKRLELNYLVDADVPAWVKGDKVRIRQVLLNVIGNAIKFTSEGEVFSQCRVYTGDDSTAGENEIMLEFIITDTGRGFSEEEKALIFKPFSQIDESSTRQHGGSGLGLVISRQLVELHGGKMEGTAVMGQGSTFTFTARCSLPTLEDRPIMPSSPGSTATLVPPTSAEVEQRAPDAMLPPTPAQRGHVGDAASLVGGEFISPGGDSTGSSNQSPHSGQSLVTDRSSITSMNTGLARFSEAAKASGQDLSQMKLEMPSDRSSAARSVTPDKKLLPEIFRPPMYLILIICPQTHSREATTQHIEMTLPKDVPHQITAVASVEEAENYIGGDDPIRFTHIVINLGEAEAVISVMDQITKSQKMDSTMILILSDSVQRQEVMKYSSGTKYEQLFSDNLVNFIYKPVKPSRFAVIFDPDRRRDLSTDWNRSTAQQMLESQKASSLELQKRMGNKGFRVLLVEDNPVNQKVMTKFLMKVAVDVDIAVDGEECLEMVFSKPHNYYSLILCDLHMPRKDGYQACREIRQWELGYGFPQMPIIALSANVMSDVQEKCAAAGFSDYVTKPVDFIDLSRAMARFF